VVTSTTAAAVTATTDTGAEIDAAIEIAIGESFDFSVVNTGSTNAITVTAGASGVTVVGLAGVAANTSGTFRVVKTAADTFIIYRI
jgi:phage tail sheath gpL-like